MGAPASANRPEGSPRQREVQADWTAPADNGSAITGYEYSTDAGDTLEDYSGQRPINGHGG